MKFAIIVFPGSNCDHDAYHVLKSIGVESKMANSSIRIGIGRFNTKSEILIELIDHKLKETYIYIYIWPHGGGQGA